MSSFILLVKPLYIEMNDSDDSFRNSVFGLTTFSQCSFLSGELTSSYVLRIIISSVVSCVICYLTGYFTLKKKFDLEPHPNTAYGFAWLYADD